jgi:hypothetical protein
MRRSVLERHGLYEANLLGNGDSDIAHAMFEHRDYWSLKKLGPAGIHHVRKWARGFSADIAGSVGFVEGTLLHLWHGSMKNRQYHLMMDILQEFDPDRDLEINEETGLYQWRSASDQVREWSRTYFANRREDG